MKKRFIYHFLVIWSFLIVTSCGGGGGDDPTPSQSLNDQLQGTWTLGTVSTNPGNFITGFTVRFASTGPNTGTVEFTINGSTVSGTYTITGNTINTTVTFNNGTVVLLSVSVSNGTLNFSSDLNDEKFRTESFTFALTQ